MSSCALCNMADRKCSSRPSSFAVNTMRTIISYLRIRDGIVAQPSHELLKSQDHLLVLRHSRLTLKIKLNDAALHHHLLSAHRRRALPTDKPRLLMNEGPGPSTFLCKRSAISHVSTKAAPQFSCELASGISVQRSCRWVRSLQVGGMAKAR